MADQAQSATASDRDPASQPHISEDIVMKDALGEEDAEGEEYDEEDMDADGEEYAEGEADADGEPDDDNQPLKRNTPGRRASTGDKQRLDQGTTDRLYDLVVYLQEYQEDGREIAGPFLVIVNKRLMPEYYEVIKEGVAFSTLRNRLTRKMYKHITEFVHDCALIFHNAQVYNRPGSLIFKDAGRMREVFKEELNKLVSEGLLTSEEAVLPDLGKLPSPEPTPPPGEEIGHDEEEEDEEEDSSEDERPNSSNKRRGVRLLKGTKTDQGDEEEESHRKRGRPPKVFTPTEARIQALLKGIRRFKNENGDLRIRHFEKLPEMKTNPEYYTIVKNPIALDTIKKKAKRKKYVNVDAVLQDMEMMFRNAMTVNVTENEVYKDAAELLKQAPIVAEQEKQKPDDDFRDEQGKLPLSEVEHKGRVWQVGDWVHLINSNDPTRPTVGQIYRIWQDSKEQRWINACWYYQPYQTVHHVDKRFYENEVVKTGQYRDHMVQDILDQCFVMFITRYSKGRPKGLPADKTVYVCEARYNEEARRFNKIKTWASCLPDEVREKDYEMEYFDVPRKLKKNLSPIKHTLPENAKETDPLPRATYRGDGPPVIGAVHKRPRDLNESLPPSPSPEPVLVSTVDKEARRVPVMQASPVRPDTMYHPSQAVPAQSPSLGYAAPYGAPPRQIQTPVPMPVSPAPQHPQGPSPVPGYASAHPPPPQTPGQHSFTPHQTATPQMPNQQQQPHMLHYPQQQQQQQQQQHQQQHQQQQQQHQQQQQQQSSQQFSHQFAPSSPAITQHLPHHPVTTYQQQPLQPQLQPHPAYQSQHSQQFGMSPAPQQRQSIAAAPAMPQASHPQPQQGSYISPSEAEVYTLATQTEALIPEHIKKNFQRDGNGNILFFTKPPLERKHKGVSDEYAGLSHSARYLADSRAGKASVLAVHASEMKANLLARMETEKEAKKSDDIPMEDASEFLTLSKPGSSENQPTPSTAQTVSKSRNSRLIHSHSVLESLDPKWEDFERLEDLIRGNCGDFAFEAFANWIKAYQGETDQMNASLGDWDKAKQEDAADKQPEKKRAERQFPHLYKADGTPKKPWLIKHEKQQAEEAKKEAERLADLGHTIRWSTDFARYLINKAAVKLIEEKDFDKE